MSSDAIKVIPLASLTAIICGMTVIAMIAGFNSPLFSTRLDAMGYSDELIGINAAANAVGPFLMAPLAAMVLARWGLARAMIAAGLLEGLLYLACILVPGFTGWTAIRLIMGAVGLASWVAGEVWITSAAPDAFRGRILAIYNSCFGLGVAVGPAMLAWAGHTGNLPFVLAALLMAAATVPVILARRLAPAMPGEHSRPSVRALLKPMRQTPLPMLLNLSYALTFMALWTFLPVYAVDTHYGVERSYHQLSFCAAGAVALQLPIGWLVDRGDRRLVGLLLLLIAVAGFACLELVVRLPWIDYIFFFFIGGLTSGLYVVALAMIGSFYRGAALASAITIFTLMWSLGSLAGPPVVGIINGALGPSGLVVALVLFCAIFVPVAAREWWRNRVPSPAGGS